MSELKPESVTILIDTREGRPFDPSPMKAEGATLQTGDYTIKGLEDYVRCERKELGDLITCMTTGRDRFKRELERLKAFPKRLVVVEASWLDLAEGNYRSELHHNSATGAVESWSGFYQVGFMFCGQRRAAQEFVNGYLFKIAKSYHTQIQRFGGE